MWVEANSGSGGGGGGETETTLWTNPRPTNSFNGTIVELSDSYTNYKKIGFYYKDSYSSNNETVTFYNKEEIDKWYDVGTYFVGAIAAIGSGSFYARYIRAYTVGTQFQFSSAYKLGATTVSTNYWIPTKITGIN